MHDKSTLFWPPEHSNIMRQLIRGFATATSTQTVKAPTGKPRRVGRSLFSKKNATGRGSTAHANSHHEIIDEPLSHPRIDKEIRSCGSVQADAFFANVAGHNLTAEDMWSPKKYTKWIMPPDNSGNQDPGTYWPDVVTDPTQLKGIHQHTVGNGIKKASYSHSIVDFTSFYLSPWTVQGVFRKTRPSIVIQWHSFLPLNGHKVNEFNNMGYAAPGMPTSTGMPLKDQRNPCPLTSGVYRSITAKIYRRIFLEEFHKTPGACDGVYVFRVRKVPESESYIRSGMAEMIKYVAGDWRNKKSLFKPDPMDTINKALQSYRIIEPLTPELAEVRRFDPTLMKPNNDGKQKTEEKLSPKRINSNDKARKLARGGPSMPVRQD
ncbi:YALI0E15532p [Yarrowia lipolytica CLIB122]|uniref:YALI0E15532p n=1 Tax=Yarrowia lipolytica (strain CLIB 122 / E 150) TaxID=284591 RepID=Q6C5S7_YARLI|nr:YALI0E15532p [Yarrowia lipolytica CLIB122]CAG79578.1 YALI0E15532p [Yarrowia lipolytica CLIB122]|eukprot:XP_503985.1 YALI0E15532p [Yarrowia lipolytica CLIB122]